MSQYRGFTVSFNAIGAGKITRKYLLLARHDFLAPLMDKNNRNIVETKCNCQMILNTRALFRKGARGIWVKYQLLVIVAPSMKQHKQAKNMIERMLPGSVVLEEYRDSARVRVQCNEFVPDNKPLVFSYQRNGIATNKYGEVLDLTSPAAPPKNKLTNQPINAPWHLTKRERAGVFLPTQSVPLQRRLNIVHVLEMLLHGIDRHGRINKNLSNSAGKEARAFLLHDRRPSAVLKAGTNADVRSPSIMFGLQ